MGGGAAFWDLKRGGKGEALIGEGDRGIRRVRLVENKK